MHASYTFIDLAAAGCASVFVILLLLYTFEEDARGKIFFTSSIMFFFFSEKEEETTGTFFLSLLRIIFCLSVDSIYLFIYFLFAPETCRPLFLSLLYRI